MNIETKRQIQLEILISTMHRSDLSFLDEMFKKNELSNLNLLIVNQTDADHILYSNQDHIRVLNVFETGLSKSRNLAIENAIGEICLIADDDVEFVNDFDTKIIAAHKAHPEASILTFKTLTLEGDPYWNYPSHATALKPFIRKILSIEVSFKRQSIVDHQIRFDENFGLGAKFQDSETFLFLREAVLKGLKTIFIPEFIVKHDAKSSSDDVASDRYIYARSALNYKLFGSLAYFYVLKLLFSLLRKGKIGFNQLAAKFKVARKSITHYKSITNA